jgi:hypothetical protein
LPPIFSRTRILSFLTAISLDLSILFNIFD